ncbi:hypothetical protein GPA19_05320 [Azoarcus indigens]|uniref:Uncharacterized protein n=1 Tax=Azoarcus indigens TaxID=29545 RepID=A0A4R6DVE7_9RHOO|nr:hypothetical protein [Azoarcus indigens]NMG64365.1 hypothetical protein [Azoarcus indigens]TDN49181.1 hypothetical protein C7389_11232 [Azoarcus indigens]
MFDDIDTPASDADLEGLDLPANEEKEAGQEEAGQAAAAEGESPDAGETQEGEKEEGQGEPAAAAEGEPTQRQERDPAIPRARFDEVNSKWRAEQERAERLEAELAQLRGAAAPVQKEEQEPAFDMVGKQKRYGEMLLAGDPEGAAKLLGEIHAEIRRAAEEEALAKATARIEANATQTQEQHDLAQAAARVLAAHPYIDGNEQAMSDLVEWRDFYAHKGMTPAQALEKAAERVALAYKPQEAPLPPAVDPRKAAAVARAAADSTAQAPAPAAGIGNRVAPPGPQVENQADWEKLSDAERDRMLAGG